MVLKVILFLLMLAGWPLNADGRLDFSYLRAWIGRYPTDKTSKPQKSLFDLSDIQLPLKELLGKKDYKHLTNELSVETPIEMVSGFLIVKVCRQHCCPCDNAMIVINLENGAMHVGFYKGGERKSNTRWYSSDGDFYELPKEILDDFLQMHHPK